MAVVDDGSAERSAPKPRAVITIYDVARASGVSASTVSRALNKPGRINAATEQRIRRIADELGYQTNPMARSLHTGRTQTLALILSDITNPVFFELIRGAERAAAELDYTLVLAESQESPEHEEATARRLLNSVDGLIMVSSRLRSEQLRDLHERKPLMLVNRRLAHVPSTVPDPRPGIAEALSHLHGLGHRSIAYLRGPATSWMTLHRERAILREADARGLAVTALETAAPTVAGGEASLESVLASGATSVLAFNDLVAIGLLRAALTAGLRIPADLSLIGFDDIFGSDFTTPAITTIRSPLAAAGESAARRLVSRILGAADDRGAPLRTELVWRRSAGPAPTRVATEPRTSTAVEH